jgi:TRAP transporter 4TM/12TM fusion protein
MPGWLQFQGFGFAEFIEIMTMTGHGLFGLTTETSVNLVFYFLAFAAIYTAVGGTEMFMDCALKLVGHRPGGAAKAEVISSAMFGSVSGSAVANVTVTGSFTIPLMIRTGYSREEAAAHEAIASTGGQFTPPVMGISAFVMADILGVPYATIALAALIPAAAYYFALYVLVDLKARHLGKGSLPREELARIAPLLARFHLLAPPVLLVAAIMTNHSATTAAIVGCIAAWACSYLPGGRAITPGRILEVTDEAAKQASQVAVPIAAMGIIIAVAIQSNLAIKFSTELMQLSGGTLLGSLFFITVGVLVLGTGLPTVAAYIVGAILFVPALKALGINELSAHFFVLFFGVLSVVTPPVAIVSYTAAGIAGANPERASWLAFALGLPAYLIPFGFLFNPAILFQGAPHVVAIAALSLAAGTAAWTILIAGYVRRPLPLPERGVYGLLAFALILAPLGDGMRVAGVIAFAAMLGYSLFLGPRLGAVPRTGG